MATANANELEDAVLLASPGYASTPAPCTCAATAFLRRPGAYRHFGKLVDDRGLRDRWHAFRDERTKAALRTWCEENGLRLSV